MNTARYWLAIVSILFVCLSGCSVEPLLSVQQAEVAQDRIQFIVSTGKIMWPVDGSKSYFARHDYLLEWHAAGPDCVNTPPLRKIDLTADCWSLNQSAGLHVDYFYGTNPDRVVRQIRRSNKGKMKQEIAIWGTAPGTDSWRVLKSWSADCDETTPAFINTPHGKYVINTQTMRMFDPDTMTDIPADAEVVRMIRYAISQPLGPSVEYYFSDDLSILRIYGNDSLNHLSVSDSRPISAGGLGSGYYLQRGDSLIHYLKPEMKDEEPPLGDWWERSMRRIDSNRGTVEYDSAICDRSLLLGAYAETNLWDIPTHTCQRIASTPACRGVTVSFPLPSKPTNQRTFDIARAFGQ